MDAARHEQIKQILGAALELEPQDREAFLNGACGEDDELAQEVRELLAASATDTNDALQLVLGSDQTLEEPHDSTTPGGRIASNETVSARAERLFGDLVRRHPELRDSDFDALCEQHLDLADELRLLLTAWQRAARVVREPPPRGGVDGSEATSRIGPYRILEELGEGGMGTVYLAEQKEPVRRRVALKVIKVGMDTKEVVARFDAERQALALMAHPNIAKVLDAGATTEGRPFFAMEHVPGVPITDYCDRQKLGLEDRIRLFQMVCSGVQHAHQKGVLHRDLKPQNILVQLHDKEPVPKIIDFGVAKATDHLLTEHTLYTEQGRIIGTLEYMSPEQAEMTGVGVDTRTDIYSLGVVLYELLSGLLPHEASELRQGGYMEIQRKIREDEPPRPSTRVTTLGRETDHLAVSRRTDSGSLARSLRGDLDWITMRCLEKDPTRRYDSASELAADLARHLNHEPVDASPPSAAYRLRKFLRKRRGPVAAGVAVFVALIGGMTVAWWQYGVAKQNEKQAKDNLRLAEQAQQRAEDAGFRELTESLRADKFKKRALLTAENVTDILRPLKDVPLADDLLKEADADLWPARPDRVRAFDPWLERATRLLERADAHRATLATLRRKALPLPPMLQRKFTELRGLQEEREAQRTLHKPSAGEVFRRRAERSELNTRIEELEVEVRDGRWRFKSNLTRFLHGVVADLVAKIDRLAGRDGVIEKVKARRQRAASLEMRSIEDRMADWERTIAAVASNDKYRGMPALVPQLGLVPLGADPRSKLEEFAVLDSGQVLDRDDEGRLQIDGDSAIVLVLIPPGTFAMGAQSTDPNKPNHDAQAHAAESPVHDVTLDAFFLSKYELTQGQWLRVMNTNPSMYQPGARVTGATITAQNPVENMNWRECTEALRRLGLRLPTEAQWEYAARAGTTTAWWTGSEKGLLAGGANLADRYLGEKSKHQYAYDAELNDGYGVHAAAGVFAANPFGLHNVIGNVSEFCRDTYGSYANDVHPRPGDGLRFRAGAGDRIARGGSWIDVARLARSALRLRYTPGLRANDLGCRPSKECITR